VRKRRRGQKRKTNVEVRGTVNIQRTTFNGRTAFFPSKASASHSSAVAATAFIPVRPLLFLFRSSVVLPLLPLLRVLRAL